MTHQIRNPQSEFRNVEPHPSSLIAQHSVLSTQSSVLSSHHLFLNLSTELLRTGMNISFQASGWSMHPTIKDGETITVKPIAPEEVKKGDIILYRSPRGVIAHRVLKKQRAVGSSHYSFTLRGDAPGDWDKPIEGRQILGKVVGVKREGNFINPYGLKVKIQRLVYFCASSVKRRLKTYKMVTKLSVVAVNRVTRE